MGGFGSGRPSSGRPKVEEAMSLNVAKLFRDGYEVDPIRWTGLRLS